jgi:hypothetical protein
MSATGGTVSPVSQAIEHHCHEYNYMNSYRGDTPCNCNGYCLCERKADEHCPCINVVPVKSKIDNPLRTLQ